MTEINGFKYSRTRFDNYFYRAIAEFEKDGESHSLDIYTTDTSRVSLERVLIQSTNPGVTFTKLVHWTSKIQDDLAAKFIDETLKGI